MDNSGAYIAIGQTEDGWIPILILDEEIADQGEVREYHFQGISFDTPEEAAKFCDEHFCPFVEQMFKQQNVKFKTHDMREVH